MLDKSFKDIRTLEKSLNAAWLRNEAISNNIANVDTPNYKREEVKFESILNESISGLSTEGKITGKNHLSIANSTVTNEPVIVKDYNSKIRKDGNNVNIDVEMANLAKNSLYYNTLSQRISGYFSKLKLVIKDGR